MLLRASTLYLIMILIFTGCVFSRNQESDISDPALAVLAKDRIVQELSGFHGWGEQDIIVEPALWAIHSMSKRPPQLFPNLTRVKIYHVSSLSVYDGPRFRVAVNTNHHTFFLNDPLKSLFQRTRIFNAMMAIEGIHIDSERSFLKYAEFYSSMITSDYCLYIVENWDDVTNKYGQGYDDLLFYWPEGTEKRITPHKFKFQRSSASSIALLTYFTMSNVKSIEKWRISISPGGKVVLLQYTILYKGSLL